MLLVVHQQFNSKEDVLQNGTDVLSVNRVVDKELERKKVIETNIGSELLQEYIEKIDGMAVYET